MRNPKNRWHNFKLEINCLKIKYKLNYIEVRGLIQ